VSLGRCLSHTIEVLKRAEDFKGGGSVLKGLEGSEVRLEVWGVKGVGEEGGVVIQTGKVGQQVLLSGKFRVHLII
jgi:hypothetical protein